MEELSRLIILDPMCKEKSRLAKYIVKTADLGTSIFWTNLCIVS